MIYVQEPLQAHSVIAVSKDGIEYYYEKGDRDDGLHDVPQGQECLVGRLKEAIGFQSMELPLDTGLYVGGESIGHQRCTVAQLQECIDAFLQELLGKIQDEQYAQWLRDSAIDEVIIPLWQPPLASSMKREVVIQRMGDQKAYMLRRGLSFVYWDEVYQADVATDAPVTDDALFIRSLSYGVAR